MPGCKFIFGLFFVALGIGMVQFAPPASAHVIDGQWCKSGESMKIKGPTIVTPGGNKIKGNYTHHSFEYIVPEGEPGAGTKVVANMLDGEEIMVTSKTTPKPQKWTRCQITS